MAVAYATGFLCLLALQAHVLAHKVVPGNATAVGSALLLFSACVIASSRWLLRAATLSWLALAALVGHFSGFLAIVLASQLGRGHALNSVARTLDLGWPAVLAVASYPLVTWSWLAGILFVAAHRSHASRSATIDPSAG